MRHFLVSLFLVETSLRALATCSIPESEFHLEGDYLMGGFFDIHDVNEPFQLNRPEAIDCSSQPFSLSSYQRFQLMRFTVEQINNSTNLLPNVSLGYEIFDQCSAIHSFPGILNLISVNGVIQPWGEPNKNPPQVNKVIAVVGPYTSTDTLTVAPLLMMDLIPVISYGAASSVLSDKKKFPSVLRTVYPNKKIIDVIFNIIQHFSWRWVAFLYSTDDFGIDGLEMFQNRIEDTEVCLAYIKGLRYDTNYFLTFREIDALRIKVIIIISPKVMAETLIESAIRLNISNKVWIAGDTWSLNKKLSKMEGIRNIGTVLGVSQTVMTIPGFREFVYSTKSQPLCESAEENMFCNQVCNCSSLSAEDVTSVESLFSFSVHSAVYAIAHALHNVLQCGIVKCNRNITAHPHLVLAELKKSNFTLLNQSIQFDENGDPKFGSYAVVFWNQSGDAEEVGFYKFHPAAYFNINSSNIKWFTNGNVPTSLCSPECPVGYKKEQDGIHKCCFKCEICPNGTYVNSTADAYTCTHCKETEWSEDGSTSCSLRVVEYVPFTDSGAIVIMVMAVVLVGLTVGMAFLFAINYNTPVVRSAGGPMCFLIFVCLNLCSLSIFFYFGTPTVASCILRYLPFLLFYTVCLACFVVRSFQIVCIFKIATKIPNLQVWWMKYHGQWLIITGAFVIQGLLLLISYSCGPPRPYNETLWYPNKIILGCDFNLKATLSSVVLLSLLCSLCFVFSYMGKDLPKNYNEAKAITFCLLLLIFTWIVFATVYMLYRGKYIHIFNALAVLSSLYSFLLWYFLPKCYIIIFQPRKNTQQYFQGLIQSYTKTISQ
ncbi:taste receptor type 1 member 1-like [Mugil cephalus]|uniref:taste receptor type 1 member 1-like n=1 Tax=Mugil cephalus TaxID=48193 RepID=UPI001FB69B12|nr:taste receptor type 1 member 1-like [Mugil cephalus]